ncbi:YolD-like family protein [Bacillus sp. EB01]|uniref:YolD-like family protein n=1 Tax=Bacillus sp. EB01 TaxID=1347086 RepID=UPI0005C5C4C0|nr:YolD-like family protein [Bacillus sp. EB01]
MGIPNQIPALSQREKIEQNILLAMEFAVPVRIKILTTGFFQEHIGFIHYVNELKKVLYLETKDKRMIQISFSSIIEAFVELT